MDFEQLMQKLKLDSHHKIERFGVLFGVLSLCMAAIVFSISVKVHKDDKADLGVRAVYSTEFTASRTGISGTVDGVYSSKDKTKVLVLLHFTDSSVISTDANNYSMFLTGSTYDMEQTPLLNSPKGGIYMFGSTGYMGLYLVDMGGFKSQIMNLTVRNAKELVQNESAEDVEYADKSFMEHDQFSLYFNPGAKGVTHCDVLDDESFTASQIYEAVVGRASEKEIRKSLDEDLRMMQTKLTMIEEYSADLERDGIIVPDAPALIRGDKVSEDKKGGLFLETERVAAGGYDFDWRHGSIKEGYIEDVTKGTEAEDYTQLFAMKQREVEAEPFSSNIQEWYKTDGSIFDAELDADGLEVNAKMQKLISAWSSYYETKCQYQKNDLAALLKLDAAVHSIDSKHTLNQGENVLTLY